MRQELDEALVRDFPQIFRGRHGGMHDCMYRGFEIGEGWEPLVRKLCEDIMATKPHPDFRCLQVKEKLGGLRFYTWAGSEEIRDLVDAAMQDSYKICENCGAREGVTTEGSWLVTLCPTCREKKNKGEVFL